MAKLGEAAETVVVSEDGKLEPKRAACDSLVGRMKEISLNQSPEASDGEIRALLRSDESVGEKEIEKLFRIDADTVPDEVVRYDKLCVDYREGGDDEVVDDEDEDGANPSESHETTISDDAPLDGKAIIAQWIAVRFVKPKKRMRSMSGFYEPRAKVIAYEMMHSLLQRQFGGSHYADPIVALLRNRDESSTMDEKEEIGRLLRIQLHRVPDQLVHLAKTVASYPDAVEEGNAGSDDESAGLIPVLAEFDSESESDSWDD